MAARNLLVRSRRLPWQINGMPFTGILFMAQAAWILYAVDSAIQDQFAAWPGWKLSMAKSSAYARIITGLCFPMQASCHGMMNYNPEKPRDGVAFCAGRSLETSSKFAASSCRIQPDAVFSAFVLVAMCSLPWRGNGGKSKGQPFWISAVIWEAGSKIGLFTQAEGSFPPDLRAADGRRKKSVFRSI